MKGQIVKREQNQFTPKADIDALEETCKMWEGKFREVKGHLEMAVRWIRKANHHRACLKSPCTCGKRILTKKR